jgi:hypothetical protein
MNDCSCNDPPSDWESVVDWCVTTLHIKSLKSSLGNLCFGACVYHLWKQRNALLYENISKTEKPL